MIVQRLAVAGNVNVDLIMGAVTPWPDPGTEVLADHHDLRPGGSAGNTALAWAGLGVEFTIASNRTQHTWRSARSAPRCPSV
jgi:sugar/nucleoside kinase (ribokinase family)